MSCYYLISSLPRLIPGERPLLEKDAFKELCRANLRDKDATVAVRLCDPPSGGEVTSLSTHPFESRWQAREVQLRNAVARARAARQGRDAAGSVRPHDGFDVGIETAVENAFDLPDPLARDQALDDARWEFLDELAGVDPFATSVVLAYAVKLRLAWRRALLNVDEGMERVEASLEERRSDSAESSV